MKIKVWDKIESINGVSAEDILSNRVDIRNADEVILFYDNTDESIVKQIEFPSILKSNYNLQGTTALEIGQAYLDYLALEKEKIIQEKTELELLQEKVAMQEQSILELSTMLTGGAV
jgi:hypothetical protein